MDQWKPSLYTTYVQGNDGDILIHNSFMGSIARVKPEHAVDINHLFSYGITDEERRNSKVLSELCDQGFFVLSNKDEKKEVAEILEKERYAEGHTIIILPHENCNFRCTYCYEDHSKGKMEDSVVRGLKEYVKRKAGSITGLHISWFGGEPLLAKDIIYDLSGSFIHDCGKNNIPYNSNITTNGYLLTSGVVEKLLECKVTHYQVTLDGPESTHDQSRVKADGGGTYKQIVDNLLYMRGTSHPFKMTIRVNFNPQSIPLLEHFLTQLSHMFGRDPRFTIYYRPIGKWGGKNDSLLNTCDETAAVNVKADLIQRTAGLGISNNALREDLKSHGLICYAAKESSFVVGVDGIIYKCTLAFNDPRNQVGRITEEGELSIDKERWDSWVTVDKLDTRGCKKCPLFASCQSKACPKYSMDQGRAMCPFTKVEYEAMLKSLVSEIESAGQTEITGKGACEREIREDPLAC